MKSSASKYHQSENFLHHLGPEGCVWIDCALFQGLTVGLQNRDNYHSEMRRGSGQRERSNIRPCTSVVDQSFDVSHM